MGDHFRNTVFRHLVRLLSGKTLPRFRDELDSTLWKLCAQTDSTATSSISGEKYGFIGSSDRATTGVSDGEEKTHNQGTDNSSERGPENVKALHQANPRHQKIKAAILVKWYGPDGPEVWCPSCYLSVGDANTCSRTPNTGRRVANC